MLGKLFSKVIPSAADTRRTGQTLPPPDISRVIKHGQSAHSPIMTEADSTYRADNAERALDSLSAQFETWMRRDLETLRETWADVQHANATAEDYRRLYTAAHNITGAAPSYGYPAVARLSQSLCKLLSQTRPGENAPLINLHVEACRAAIAAGPQGDASHSIADAVCDALERRVAARVENRQRAG